MGLDIRAFSKIEFVRKQTDRDDWGEDLEEKGLMVLIVPKKVDFPAASRGLVKGSVYQLSPGGTTFSFRAGSYTSYGMWRDILEVMFSEERPGILGRLRGRHGPFEELIYFSDHEGVIAGKTLQKLSKEFQKNYPTAKKRIQETLEKNEYDKEGWNSSVWLSVYKNFMKAFGLASPDGLINFE